eukprot:scaffold48_cov311-Pinguiococcus_pyrenoidosus.AAC.202
MHCQSAFDLSSNVASRISQGRIRKRSCCCTKLLAPRSTLSDQRRLFFLDALRDFLVGTLVLLARGAAASFAAPLPVVDRSAALFCRASSAFAACSGAIVDLPFAFVASRFPFSTASPDGDTMPSIGSKPRSSSISCRTSLEISDDLCLL